MALSQVYGYLHTLTHTNVTNTECISMLFHSNVFIYSCMLSTYTLQILYAMMMVVFYINLVKASLNENAAKLAAINFL